jgi:CheY-like chemotaxis protein
VPHPGGLAGRRVIVVDDNATNREILERHAKAGGMRTATAADGLIALKLMHEAVKAGDPYELAIIDMKMPHMDGIELANALRADSVFAGLRLVLVTSLHSTDEMARAREVGFSAYLSKPVRRQDLYRALAQASGGMPAEDIVAASGAAPSARIRAKVLMAEDNGVNQVVARNMLKSLGCEWEIVVNGREALNAVQRDRYDIVLMDCQMPEMDGYAATRALREWEGAHPSARRLPVIALTANALVGDAETCMAAGMDAHLAKPYTRAQLAGVMARWLPAALVDSQPEAAPAAVAAAAELAAAVPEAAAEEEAPLIDEAALDNIRALDDGGEESVLDEVIGIFLAELPQHLQALRDGLRAARPAELGRIAHAFKSASFNVGAMPLGELCRALEKLGKAGEMQGTVELVAAIERMAARVAPLLQAELRQAA